MKLSDKLEVLNKKMIVVIQFDVSREPLMDKELKLYLYNTRIWLNSSSGKD